MKILKRVLIVLVILVGALWFARNEIIKRAASEAIRQTTGFDIEMGRVHAGLFTSVFEISDTQLLNPEEFQDRLAMEIKTMRVGYDLSSLFTDEIHLTEIVLDVPTTVLVIREDGESNLERLGRAARKDDGTSPDGNAQAEGPDKPKKGMRIDSLTLRIGKIEMRRYEEGKEKPEVEVFDIHFDRTAHSVTNLDVVNGMITAAMIEGMGSRAIQGLSAALQNSDGDSEQLGKELEKQAKSLGKSLKQLFDKPDEE